MSKLVAATCTGIVKRQFIVLSGPSGILPHKKAIYCLAQS